MEPGKNVFQRRQCHCHRWVNNIPKRKKGSPPVMSGFQKQMTMPIATDLWQYFQKERRDAPPVTNDFSTKWQCRSTDGIKHPLKERKISFQWWTISSTKWQICLLPMLTKSLRKEEIPPPVHERFQLQWQALPMVTTSLRKKRSFLHDERFSTMTMPLLPLVTTSLRKEEILSSDERISSLQWQCVATDVDNIP